MRTTLVAAIAVLAAGFAQSADTLAQAHTLKPQDIFKDCSACPEMVAIPAGQFMMGSPDNEVERLSYESPRHLVKIATPFAAGRFAVRFDEWDACVAEGGCQPSTDARAWDERWGRGQRPVINVSWYDAKDYVSVAAIAALAAGFAQPADTHFRGGSFEERTLIVTRPRVQIAATCITFVVARKHALA